MWQCAKHLMGAWRLKIQSRFNNKTLTNTLWWTGIGQRSLLHLCSLLRLKTFLTIKTWRGVRGGYRWHCLASSYRPSSLLDTLGATRGCILIFQEISNSKYRRWLSLYNVLKRFHYEVTIKGNVIIYAAESGKISYNIIQRSYMFEYWYLLL
jgi:hypothetical protein